MGGKGIDEGICFEVFSFFFSLVCVGGGKRRGGGAKQK